MTRLENRTSIPGKARNVSVIAFSLALGFTQLLTGWVPETFSPRVKRMEREANHSLPVSAEGMLYGATILCCGA